MVFVEEIDSVRKVTGMLTKPWSYFRVFVFCQHWNSYTSWAGIS